jgi:AcrR family transcriptional regulator
VELAPGFVVVRERARPLPPDDRREAILEAIIPLLKERGRNVTSRELAEAAEVAEGTLFRAFGDKDSIIRAAIEKMLDPKPFRDTLRTIRRDQSLEEKLADIIEHLRQRFHGVFAIMATFEMTGRPPVPPAGGGEEWIAIVRELLEDDVDRLAVPVDTVAYYLRLVAFSSSLPPFNTTRSFDPAELATLITHGVAVPSTPAPPSPPRPRTPAASRRAAAA